MSVGRVLGGRHRLVERLGVGGMGEVFRALDTESGRGVALKRLIPNDRPDHDAQALRFRREFHTMAGLRHPRIVEVYEFAVDEEGAPFYTMELLDGRDLRALGKVAPREACRLLRDVASALAYLHARRLLHRDVAARNVRETSDGRVKLFDFGVLATPGLTADVAGTPPHVAPENVWRLPLDARADLFGLGGLAYWMLTGVHAYPARTLVELPDVWRRRPAPPSALEPSVPEPLDRLVMSMLSLDPLGRPRTAAEVIDRLTAAGGLEPDEDAESAQSWLASTALVGRGREMTQLDRRLGRALDGRGRAVILEAPSGAGKSRLLRELGLNAQIAGATVVHVSGDVAERAPYGVVRELARQIRAAAPDDAAAAAVDREETLARLAPEALARASRTSTPGGPGDPAAERLKAQSDLVGWLADTASRRPLVVLVDDVQRADEASATVLATLAWEARRKRLLVAATLRTDEPVRARAPIGALRDAASVLPLSGLGPRDVEQLVIATFGETPNASALAAFLHAAAGGHPLRTTELLRHLVGRGVLKYADGRWSIPERLSDEGLPRGLVEALDARIASLDPVARRLGQALAVLGGDVQLATAMALADDDETEADDRERAVFAALDTLEYEEILASSAGTYRFRHDGLREALLRSLDPSRRRALHLRAAEVLLGDPSADREVETGWHLFRGGDRTRGAQLLERAGRRLFDAQSFADAILPLEAALDVLEREGAPPVRTLDVRRLLVVCGTMADRDVVLRHAPDTIEQLRHHAGALVAEKASRLLGARLGFLVGVGVAWVRSWLTAAEHAGPRPPDALAHLFAAAAYVASAWSLSFEPERIGHLIDVVRPVAAFENRVPYAAYLLLHCFRALAFGRWRTVLDEGRRALRVLETDELTPMPSVDRQNGRGAVHYMAASAHVIDQDPAYAKSLASLDSLGLRFFDASTTMARLYWHRLRGEEDRAEELEREAARKSLSLGTVWVLESQSTWMSYVAYAFTRDVAGLKRCIEAMERLCGRGYRFEPFVLAARADYHRERGELADAERSAQQALDTTPEQDGFRRLAALAALAETQIAKGEADAAKASARAGLAIAADADRAMVTYRARLQRALALAQALDGDHEAADAMLETAQSEVDSRKSPVLSGALAEARARVALLAGDMPRFEVHRAEADRWFRPTRNPTLIARADRLDDLRVKATEGDRAARLVAADAVTARAALPARSWIVATLRSLSGSARTRRALELLLTASSARRGWLFRPRDGELVVVASSDDDAPSAATISALSRLATAATDSERTMDETIESATRGPWLPVLLVVRDGAGRPRLVAAAALVAGSLPLVHPDARDVVEIARQLEESTDPGDDDERAV